MIEAGLLHHGEGIAVPYDRFRNRVMFPIHDRSGRVVAFGGRALDPDAKAKYLNSPETELFHKGSLLFNHHRARKPAHERQQIIVVEGYVDVIAMSQAGFPQTVAPLGTALTADQCALLWALNAEPILCFDGDNAGRKAAFRAIDIALPLIGAGKSLSFALAARGPGPRRPRALGRAGGDRRGSARRQAVRRNAVPARDRGPDVRDAGTARRPRAAPARTDRRDRRRDACASTTPPTWLRRLDALFGPAPAVAPAARFRDRAARRAGAAAFSIRARASA